MMSSFVVDTNYWEKFITLAKIKTAEHDHTRQSSIRRTLPLRRLRVSLKGFLKS